MEDLFINILNNAIVSSMLIVAIVVLRLVFKKIPKWIHCLLWALVAIKLIIPFSIDSPLGLLPRHNPIPEDITVVNVPEVDTGISMVDSSINTALAENFARDNAEFVTVTPMGIAVYISSYIWIAGIVVMMLYFTVSFILMKRKVAASINTGDNVYECDDIAGPFILGFLAPRIYIPSGMDDKVKKYVIAHENTHISRRDYLWKPLGFIILAIYWFNPLCWVSYILLCRDIEYACDEKTTKDVNADWKADYCQALLNCSIQKRMITACPVAFGEVNVKDRVKKVIDDKKPAIIAIVAAGIVCVLVAICFMTRSERPGIFEATEVAIEPELISVSYDEISEDNEAFDEKTIDEGATDNEAINSEVTEPEPLVWPTESTVIAKGFSDNESLPEGSPEGVKAERISIAAPVGTPVYSASSGTVIDTGFDSYDGNYIEILSDDGFHFGYYHLEKVNISTGDSITAGNEIGTVGNTGSSTGPHLGFSMGEQQGSEFVYLDPLNFFE